MLSRVLIFVIRMREFAIFVCANMTNTGLGLGLFVRVFVGATICEVVQVTESQCTSAEYPLEHPFIGLSCTYWMVPLPSELPNGLTPQNL